MALIVGITAIITQEAHGIILGNMLRVVLHELLGAIPKGGDGVDVLIQTENEAVLLTTFLHDTEGIVVNIAVELDGGLNAPVVLVVHHEGVAEEEAGLEAAHVTVANGVTVDNLPLLHVLAHLLGFFLVNPLGERPMFHRDLAIESVSRNQRAGYLLECVVKRLIIEEDPVVVVTAVEAVFDLTNGASNLPDVGVSGKGDKSGVDTRTTRNAREIVPASIVRCHGHRVLRRVIVGIVSLYLARRIDLGLGRTDRATLLQRGLLRAGAETTGSNSDSFILGVGNEVEEAEGLQES